MSNRPIKLIIVFVAMLFIGFTIPFSSLNDSQKQDYFEITKNLKIIASIYEKINTLYVDEPIPGELMKAGIDAMLQSLDPYTVYIPESNIEDYRFMTTGQYGGIGAVIKYIDDKLTITEPYENSPCQIAGLQAGDHIIEVEGESTKGRTTEEMSTLLKGSAETSVKIKYVRHNEIKEVSIIRKKIDIPAVPYYGMLDEQIGYIKLTSFTDKASAGILKGLEDLKENENMQKVIIDLRGNGGGLLGEAVNIVNMFIAKDQKVVETKGRIEEINRTYKTRNAPFDLDIPVVILIDAYSASASEIVAGSLQDLDRGVIIGNRSFGKGLVQQTKDVKFGAKVKLTVAKYYTPSGRCIQKLDYSNKNQYGQVSEVADSLIQTYYTKNGREVKDARGVDPDVKIESGYYSRLSEVLIYNDHIFKYVNKYVRSHASLPPVKEFSLSEGEYNLFKEFLKKQEISYSNESSEFLNELIHSTEREKLYSSNKDQLESLKIQLKPDLSNDLERHKEEIIDVLENEIVSRFYYQKGRVEASLKNDPYILKAKKVLGNIEEYHKILNP